MVKSNKGYDKIYGNNNFHKGSSNVNPHEGVNNPRNSRGRVGGNSCTDSKNSIMIISRKIDNNYFFINNKGLFREGELEVKTQRNYDKDGKLLKKEKYVALRKGLNPSKDWSKNNYAMEFCSYINSQISSCLKRGWGNIYAFDFDFIEYSELQRLAEQDKGIALDLLSSHNGCTNILNSLLKNIAKFSQQQM